MNNIEHTASHVMKKLRHMGCDVIHSMRTPRGALIHIQHPTDEMASQAVEIRQTIQGTPSTVYTIQLHGCTVNWTEGTTQ